MAISPPQIQTTRLLLRPFRANDASTVQRLAGTRAVADTTLNVPHPYEDGMAEQWIDSHAGDMAAGTTLSLAICSMAPENLLGCISLRIDDRFKRANMGYWIGEPFWGKGYCTEAVRAVVDYSFSTLQLNRVEAEHFVRNPASGRIMEKVGMRREGTLRQHVMKWSEFEDQDVYAILREDWAMSQLA